MTTRALTSLTVVAALAACPLTAAPRLGAEHPIVAEQITGTGFTLTPQLAYEGAVLKLIGPAGQTHHHPGYRLPPLPLSRMDPLR